ncbi:MBL fold metallo-hydrolase [Streptomyces sp. NBC_01477]|uniref:MBL fold metallo-hydrolase n=1 Tax=Streptomyces sp. NBC_01477 TaxID=2976015 RepID=UPI002E2EC3B5|nr:MBL fold metallo-hydrolase [Streptomyces sp. NBC_01477]
MTSELPASRRLTVHYLGGPTAVLEIGGVRLLTDPTFDAPGDYPTPGGTLVKTVGPAIGPADIGPVAAVLLSHDQHPDNLDDAGRAHLADVPLVLSTASARERLGGATRSLANWEHVELPRPDGGTLRVTGVPAKHGPEGTEALVGEVTGFVLSGDALPTVYVSGDNVSLDAVRAIAGRFGAFDIAVLFAGGAQAPAMPGVNLTLPSDWAAQATEILGTPEVVPVHFEHWAHFTQDGDTLVRAFDAAGLSARLHLLKPGDRIGLG